ncbi:hypothetical protein AB0L35_38500 [Streptomyces sp. NPDC052309]|uniref:Acyl-CoA carboxylase subunit epsilon n=1 Tax=Streptomyces griseicoloratus TaxID=2752516 RepID=A0A926LC37_9ACTN|nr:hypothetical protein [Streptomyces griseicoloratus]MBD0424101.1 hypothetical protein [Streptomyces griseicoloratus]
MAVRAVSAVTDLYAGAAGQVWRITGGSPTPEEVAAVAAVLSAVLAARADETAREVREQDGGRRRDGARWLPSATRRRAATSWAAAHAPTWRDAA